MTLDDRFVRSVADWLDDQAGLSPPGYLDEVLARTRQTRQRQWWSSLERWLPMDTTLRLAPAPKLSLLLLVIGVIVALVAIVVAAGSQPHVPGPFGPAENGALVYSSRGDISIMTPDGRRKTIITGSTQDLAPGFAHDGSTFAFLRTTGGLSRSALMQANADGSNVRELASSIDDPSGAEWSPDGSSIALASRIDNQPALWTLDVATRARQVLVAGIRAENLAWTPDGRELVFRGQKPESGNVTFGLYRVGADGNGLRSILPLSLSEENYQEPALSPDGTRLMYTQWQGDAYAGGHLYVLGAGAGESRRVWFDGGRTAESDYFAEWSPDGTKIVLNRGTARDKYHLAVGPADGGTVVDIGPELGWDAAAVAAFSPDGSKVIARYGNGQTWILDVGGGPGQLLDIATTDLVSWQRIGR